MPALSFPSIYDAAPSFLPQPSVSPFSSKMQYSVQPPPSPPVVSASSQSQPFHHSVRRVSHPAQQQEAIVYAHSPPLPHSQLHSHPHSSNAQSVYVVPSHSYSPPSASFQRALPAQVATAQPAYHTVAAQPHSPTHAGAFRPFKSAPLSPPSASRPTIVYSFPAAAQPANSTTSPSSPIPAVSSSQPTILIHPSSYSPSQPYPRLLSSPVPHSPVDAVVRPLAVRRTGSPPLPPSALLTVPLTSQSSCPTCSQHSHSHSHSPPLSHSHLQSRSLSSGAAGGFVVSSGPPQYHSLHHPLQQQPQSHPSHRLSPACIAAGCAYPVSPRSDSRMLVSDDDDAYSHHSQHSHLSLPSSSSSSSHSIGQPRYSSGPSSFIPSQHYVVAGSYSYSTPVTHSHIQMLPSPQPGRAGLPGHIQYGPPPPGTAYTVQSIPIATLSPQSASPSSASSTSSSLSGPFPSAASSTSVGSSSMSSSNPSSPRAAKSKRSAAHMREFVRNYFLRNSASLVNKDLTSISAELQAAYEKETSTGDGAADGGGDRKPVFCRTFIQKVARSLGFILTLHFGLVDKRMKHLMKIRKRGKKTNRRQHHTADIKQQQQRGQQSEQPVKHEQQPSQPLSDYTGGGQHSVDVIENEVAAAAQHMEEMAAALDARVAERAAVSEEAASITQEEEPVDCRSVQKDDERKEGDSATSTTAAVVAGAVAGMHDQPVNMQQAATTMDV